MNFNKYNEIIFSDEFQQCYSRRHHFNTNAASHMLNVATKSHKMALWLNNHGFSIDMDSLIRACLCHDIMIVESARSHGRFSKIILGWTHPIDSAKLAKSKFHLDDKAVKAIKYHMFPLCVIPPLSKEGWILCMADKFCTYSEVLNRFEKITVGVNNVQMSWGSN